MNRSIKNTGLFYKDNSVKKLAQGGLTMNYGYRDPNKDMYRNINQSLIFKEGLKNRTSVKYGKNWNAGDFATANKGVDTNNAPSKTFASNISNAPNDSFGSGLLYQVPKKGITFSNSSEADSPDVAPNITKVAPNVASTAIDDAAKTTNTAASRAAGAISLAGTANSAIQPALAGLDDKDNLTYTGKEKIGDVASSTLNTALAGASTSMAISSMVAGAAAGTAGFPVLGTVIGAVVGFGIGLLKGGKKKKEAKKAREQRDYSLLAKNDAKNRALNAKRDSYITGTSDSTYPGLETNSSKKVGAPGGYLTT